MKTKTETIEYEVLKPTTKNIFKVNKKQWRKWNKLARKVFNEVYDAIKSGHKVIYPDGVMHLDKKTIQVMAWNTAWLAADAAN